MICLFRRGGFPLFYFVFFICFKTLQKGKNNVKNVILFLTYGVQRGIIHIEIKKRGERKMEQLKLNFLEEEGKEEGKEEWRKNLPTFPTIYWRNSDPHFPEYDAWLLSKGWTKDDIFDLKVHGVPGVSKIHRYLQVDKKYYIYFDLLSSKFGLRISPYGLNKYANKIIVAEFVHGYQSVEYYATLIFRKAWETPGVYPICYPSCKRTRNIKRIIVKAMENQL